MHKLGLYGLERIRNSGDLIIAFIGLFLFAALFDISVQKFFASNLDSAVFVDNVRKTLELGAPLSQVNLSWHTALETVIVQEAAAVCSSALVMDPTSTINMLTRHAYLILYPLSFIALISNELSAVAMYHTVSFVGLLAAVFLYLRIKNVPLFFALLFVFLIGSHPNWSEAVLGQFYVDRIFIFSGTVFLLSLYERLSNNSGSDGLLVVSGLISCIATERAAIMIFGAIFSMLVMSRFPNKFKKGDQWLALVGLVIVLYTAVFLLLVQDNSDYGSFGSSFLSYPERLILDENLRNASIKFLLINLPLLICCFFSKWFLVVAIGALIPNLVGNIGGAEKLGWTTHYHSMYFPFLVAGATIGLANLEKYKKLPMVNVGKVFVFLTMSNYLATVDLYDTQKFLSFADRQQSETTLFKLGRVAVGADHEFTFSAAEMFFKPAATIVPQSASVTTSESFMPALVGGQRTVHYYPVGLDTVDYVVSWYNKRDDGKMIFSSSVSYLGIDNKTKLDMCLTERIERQGFKLEHSIPAVQDGSQGVAIMKRTIN